MIFAYLGLAALSIILIVKGSDWFIDSSVRIADLTGVPRLIIGAALIGFFTNLPELVVAVLAAIRNHPSMIFGTAVGSIAANMGVVLGATVLIRPLPVARGPLRQQGIFLVLSAILLYVLSYTGVFGRLTGVLLIAAMGGWVWYSVRAGYLRDLPLRSTRGQAAPGNNTDYDLLAKNSIEFIAGGALVTLGAHLLLSSSIAIAHRCGIAEVVIAATLVAGGASLPELAASAGAAFKGHTDISLGTIIGSSIFHLLGTVGVGCLLRPIPVTRQNQLLDLPVMFFFICAVLFWGMRGDALTRKHGRILMWGYGLYLYVLLFSYGAFA
jgi:cation:H+ antiporter